MSTYEGGAPPDLPKRPDGPVFSAPWQAQAFAMVLALHERGAFTWSQWAQTLSSAISAAQVAGDPDHGDTYYTHWLNALESLVISQGLGQAAQIHALEHAWADAAARTPHGQPIALNDEENALALSHPGAPARAPAD